MDSQFINNLIDRAKSNPQSIVFPESNNQKVLAAARRVYDMGVATPILVGKSDEIEALAANLEISTVGFKYIDHTSEETLQNLIKKYMELSSEMTEKSLNRKLKYALNFAAAMVRVGDADCLAAGIDHTTGEVLMASQMFIGMQEGIKTISSLGIVETPEYVGVKGNLLAITDCAVCINPDASELADIACASSDTMRSLLGWETKAALLSFSTDGSSEHELSAKVIEAVRLANERRPELAIDGEFQFDAAISPVIAAKKVKKESKVAGQANIIVFPDLNAGNIGVKLIQTFGKALAHGPLLQGFSKPVSDFSRSAPIDEIVGNLVMLVVRAGNQELGTGNKK